MVNQNMERLIKHGVMKKILFISYIHKNGKTASLKIWTKQRENGEEARKNPGCRYAEAIDRIYHDLVNAASDGIQVNTEDISNISDFGYISCQLTDRSIKNPDKTDGKSGKKEWQNRYKDLVDHLVQNMKTLMDHERIKCFIDENNQKCYRWTHTTATGSINLSVNGSFDTEIQEMKRKEIIDMTKSDEESEDIFDEDVVFMNDDENRPLNRRPMKRRKINKANIDGKNV